MAPPLRLATLTEKSNTLETNPISRDLYLSKLYLTPQSSGRHLQARTITDGSLVH